MGSRDPNLPRVCVQSLSGVRRRQQSLDSDGKEAGQALHLSGVRVGRGEHVPGREEAVGGRILHEPRLQVPWPVPLSQQASLAKCRFKGTMIKDFKQLLQNTEPQARALLNVEPCVTHWSHTHEAGPGWEPSATLPP